MVGADVADDVQRPDPGLQLRSIQPERLSDVVADAERREAVEVREPSPVENVDSNPDRDDGVALLAMVDDELFTRVSDQPIKLRDPEWIVGRSVHREQLGLAVDHRVDLAEVVPEQRAKVGFDVLKRSERRRTQAIVELPYRFDLRERGGRGENDRSAHRSSP